MFMVFENLCIVFVFILFEIINLRSCLVKVGYGSKCCFVNLK